MNANYPEEEWTHVYTDGSTIEATRDGGGGVYTKYRAEESFISVASEKYVTNFTVEAMALNTAATEIQSTLTRPTRNLMLSTPFPSPPPQKKKKKEKKKESSYIIFQVSCPNRVLGWR